MGDTYALVSWTTNYPATSLVEVTDAVTGAVFIVGNGTEYTLDHEVEIIGLSPESLYYIRNISILENGATAMESLFNSILTSF